MRATGYLLVAAIFVAVALSAYAVIRAVGSQTHSFALLVAAVVASSAGVLVWHRQSPESAERSVKLGLGVALSVTAVAFSLVFQAISGWLAFPEVIVPMAAIGCFLFPFAVVGQVWEGLSQSKPSEGKDTEPGAAPDSGGT